MQRKDYTNTTHEPAHIQYPRWVHGRGRCHNHRIWWLSPTWATVWADSTLQVFAACEAPDHVPSSLPIIHWWLDIIVKIIQWYILCFQSDFACIGHNLMIWAYMDLLTRYIGVVEVGNFHACVLNNVYKQPMRMEKQKGEHNKTISAPNLIKPWNYPARPFGHKHVSACEHSCLNWILAGSLTQSIGIVEVLGTYKNPTQRLSYQHGRHGASTWPTYSILYVSQCGMRLWRGKNAMYAQHHIKHMACLCKLCKGSKKYMAVDTVGKHLMENERHHSFRRWRGSGVRAFLMMNGMITFAAVEPSSKHVQWTGILDHKGCLKMWMPSRPQLSRRPVRLTV